MGIIALFVAAFLQLEALSLDQLRKAISSVAMTLAQEYVDATKGEPRRGSLIPDVAPTEETGQVRHPASPRR
jgi:hypothetical protein